MKSSTLPGTILSGLDSHGWFSLFRRGALILLVSGLLGLSVNALSPRGLPLLGTVPVRESGGIARIGLPEAWELHQARKGVFVDARSEEDYRSGHIRGAILLDQESFETSISAFQELVPLDTLLVAYCSGEGCGSSSEVAQLLKEAGYRNLRVFSGGWEEWSKGGYPVEGERPRERGVTRDQDPEENRDLLR